MNIHAMLDSVRELADGHYAEAGVWKGFMAHVISQQVTPGCALWLFDSFAGHGEPSEFDDAVRHPKGRYADTSQAEVRQMVPHAVIVSGWIPDSLEIVDGWRFRFVHIDLDHYWPTKAACEFFKPRMVSGGIIRFDDYGFAECPGATKAVDEVFGRANVLTEDARWIAP